MTDQPIDFTGLLTELKALPSCDDDGNVLVSPPLYDAITAALLAADTLRDSNERFTRANEHLANEIEAAEARTLSAEAARDALRAAIRAQITKLEERSEWLRKRAYGQQPQDAVFEAAYLEAARDLDALRALLGPV